MFLSKKLWIVGMFKSTSTNWIPGYETYTIKVIKNLPWCIVKVS